jgi:voltage-dependent calcium channel L type alpha-1D
VCRSLSLGARVYVRDKFNVFDVFVVSISLVDLALNPPSVLTGIVLHSKGPATALRALRLFRVFKLARSWVSLRELLGTIARTIMDLANFTVLLILIIYIFALFGMQMFANRLVFDTDTNLALTNVTSAAYAAGSIPRYRFDSLLYAVTAVFQVSAFCSGCRLALSHVT